MRRRLWIVVGLAVVVGACQYSVEPLCSDRRCAAPDAPDAGGGVCRGDVDCPLGAICDGARCAAGCRSTRDCPPEQSCDTSHQPYGVCAGPTARADAAPAAPDAGAACTDMWIPLLVNGDFESGPSVGWVEHPGANEALIIQPRPQDVIQPHGGANLAQLGYAGTTESITQTFTIPADADALKVQGAWQLSTWEASGLPYDTAVLSISVPSGKLLDLTNQDQTSTWMAFGKTTTYAVPPEQRGVQSTLTAQVVNDAQFATHLYLDDVTVLARVCR